MNKQVSKPRNHVALAMIRSNKHSGAHQGNYRDMLEREIVREQLFDDLMAAEFREYQNV